MTTTSGQISCGLGCWIVAALGGLLAGALLMILGGWTFTQAVFGGGVVFVVAGLLVSWLICKPLPPLGASRDMPASGAHASAPSPAAPSPAPSSPAPASGPASAAPARADLVTPSAALPGQAELATRKGSWTYQNPDAQAKPAPVAASPAPAAPIEGSQPETLATARDGKPDNLKLIKGVGPKLEGVLHGMGYFHFDQIAAWSTQDVAWADQNLVGFKGRVSRDNWVDQARTLAAGGETEFSKRNS